jgi:hypothetical protein
MSLFDPPTLVQLDRTTETILGIIGGGSPGPQRLRAGVFQIDHFSFDFYLPGTSNTHRPGSWDEYPEFPECPGAAEFMGHSISTWSAYGVCDSVEQFFETEFGKFIESSDRSFAISFTRIAKSEEPDDGGWRWHKWGPYIGRHEPQYEYLYDEKGIEEVFVYHVFEHVDGKAICGPLAWTRD